MLVANGLLSAASGPETAAGSAEIFDPSTGNFTPTASTNRPRFGGYAVALPNGKILVAGGNSDAELFDPASGTFGITGAPVDGVRYSAVATLLSNGQVLVVGGYLFTGAPTASSELYIPASASFTPSGNMTVPRGEFAGALLPDGRVLAAGGFGSFNPTLNGLPALRFRRGLYSRRPRPGNVAIRINFSRRPRQYRSGIAKRRGAEYHFDDSLDRLHAYLSRRKLADRHSVRRQQLARR